MTYHVAYTYPNGDPIPYPYWPGEEYKAECKRLALAYAARNLARYGPPPAKVRAYSPAQLFFALVTERARMVED